jgi:hypothetical protein
MTELRAGIYRHFKGALYEVLGECHDANNETRQCVLYVPLAPVSGPRCAVRTREDFEALVCTSNTHEGDECVYVPRFDFLGAVREAWMGPAAGAQE